MNVNRRVKSKEWEYPRLQSLAGEDPPVSAQDVITFFVRRRRRKAAREVSSKEHRLVLGSIDGMNSAEAVEDVITELVRTQQQIPRDVHAEEGRFSLRRLLLGRMNLTHNMHRAESI